MTLSGAQAVVKGLSPCPRIIFYQVQWTAHGHSTALQNVGVDHGRAHVLVPQKFLHGADIVAVLQEVGSEGMTEGVASDAFLQAGLCQRP
jgi:hypothetical protein